MMKVAWNRLLNICVKFNRLKFLHKFFKIMDIFACFSNFNMNAKVQKLALDMGKIDPSSPTRDGDMVCMKFSYIGTGPRGSKI